MTARIVVGVDGSDQSRAALARALEEARLRDAMVEAVHAWSPPIYWGGLEYGVSQLPTRTEVEDAAAARLDEVLASFPEDVVIEPLVVEGSPARVLVDLSQGADLLVVGSRGRGGFAGLVLGSTSHGVVGHAHCPVLVVGEESARSAARAA
ncbi:universal stress protein [Salsipaludibacter albus]|uniref:universal stress protein n=1 Tax=Salsipaludibacter albus TaxID=2849650 RepID=UPI001EE47F06|nr:universal stress protein [Salsipaludibacter albus]MBY5161942.1 universal stress protein [Salsipaludibacter albus]